MLYRFGSIPSIPVFGDEIVINDPAIALSRGRGLVAPSFAGSSLGIDKLFAHFPPVYIYLQAAIFQIFGVSAYSLRLLTTMCSIAAAALFSVLVDRLCKQGLANPRAGIFVICLYTLSAPVIILHRMSRMESLIEVFTLTSIFCIFKLIFPAVRTPSSTIYVLIASFLCGLSLATHPEAINAVLPISLIALFSEQIAVRQKLIGIAVAVLTPFAIWMATYKLLWRVALGQMINIARQKAPDPGFSRFGTDLLGRASSSQHDFMVFFFFCLTASSMVIAFVRAIRAVRAPLLPQDCVSRSKLSMYRAVVIAVPITFLVLVFALPASITRYEVIYPVYLLLLTVTPLVSPHSAYLRVPRRAIAMLLILVQFIGCIVYLNKDRSTADAVADRYDPVLTCISPNARIAASPQLWLAFQKRDRPFTVLYPGLDGLENWRRTSAQPLYSFDVILLSDYIRDDFDLYAPLSKPGRTERDIPIGSRTLHLYFRSAPVNGSSLIAACNPQQ